MSAASASFFAWIQATRIYEEVHGRAVSLAPAGQGRTWLDVGTGPGLVARLAAERGYAVTGIDADPAMVRAARRNMPDAHVQLEVCSVEQLTSRHDADVVSAASLLTVLEDPGRGAELLWQRVRAGGLLLVIETTTQMEPERMATLLPRIEDGRSRLVLRLWANARRGRAVAAQVLARLPAVGHERHLLLDGLVEAHMLRRAGA